MGEVFVEAGGWLTIVSHFVFYGSDVERDLALRLAAECEEGWNESAATVRLGGADYRVRFRISAEAFPQISPEEILGNTLPRNNYFRIEPYCNLHISFVDGLGSNTGYFKTDNLYAGSTTVTHEYGHTLGLPHPIDLDYRGQGAPGIMYPRGTLVDPAYQYDPAVPAGQNGGTMHPMHRKVRAGDVHDIGLHRLRFDAGGRAVVGSFTSIYHEAHKP